MTHPPDSASPTATVADYAVTPGSTIAELQVPAGGERLRQAVALATPEPPAGPAAERTATTSARPRIREAAVRSILFRRRLAEALVALELAVLEELRQTGRETYRVGDYVVRDTPTGLAITEAPATDPRQLELPLP